MCKKWKRLAAVGIFLAALFMLGRPVRALEPAPDWSRYDSLTVNTGAGGGYEAKAAEDGGIYMIHGGSRVSAPCKLVKRLIRYSGGLPAAAAILYRGYPGNIDGAIERHFGQDRPDDERLWFLTQLALSGETDPSLDAKETAYWKELLEGPPPSPAFLREDGESPSPVSISLSGAEDGLLFSWTWDRWQWETQPFSVTLNSGEADSFSLEAPSGVEVRRWTDGEPGEAADSFSFDETILLTALNQPEMGEVVLTVDGTPIYSPGIYLYTPEDTFTQAEGWEWGGGGFSLEASRIIQWAGDYAEYLLEHSEWAADCPQEWDLQGRAARFLEQYAEITDYQLSQWGMGFLDGPQAGKGTAPVTRADELREAVLDLIRPGCWTQGAIAVSGVLTDSVPGTEAEWAALYQTLRNCLENGTFVMDTVQFAKILYDGEGDKQFSFPYSLERESLTGGFRLTKTENGKPDVLLEGAEFELEEITDGESTVVGTMETDSGGELGWYGLPLGDYRLTEIRAPDGYLPISSPLEFTISQDDLDLSFSLVDPVDTRPTGSFTLLKHDAEDKGLTLAGAVFMLEKSKVNGDWEIVEAGMKTDGAGILRRDGLYQGEYLLSETKAPEGYMAPLFPIAFTIGDDTLNLSFSYANTKRPDVTGGFTLNKRGDNGKALSSAVFRLERLEAGGGYALVEEGLTTDEKGQLSRDGLPYGTYRLTETAAPDGYHMDNSPLDFTLSGDAPLISLEAVNHPLNPDEPEKPLSGGFTLNKRGNNGKALSGAVFRLERLEAGGGYTLVEEGLTTDEKGQLSRDGLPYGTYRLTETAAPDGYHMDGSPLDFTLSGDAPLISLEAVNHPLNPDKPEKPLSGGFTLNKKGDNGKALSGAVFRLEQRQKNGTFLVIEDYLTTDSQGEIKRDGLALGDYRLSERMAPEGYALDSSPLDFSLTEEAARLSLIAVNRKKPPVAPPDTPSKETPKGETGTRAKPPAPSPLSPPVPASAVPIQEKPPIREAPPSADIPVMEGTEKNPPTGNGPGLLYAAIPAALLSAAVLMRDRKGEGMKNRRKKRAWLCGLLASCALLVFPLAVYAEDTAPPPDTTVPTTSTDTSGTDSGTDSTPPPDTSAPDTSVPETSTPEPPKGDIRLSILSPADWSTKTATVEIRAEDLGGTGIAKVEAKIGQGGAWQDVMDSGRLEISENCTVYVQAVDREGKQFTKSRYVECFDREAPTVSASISGGLMQIRAEDGLSGIAGIYVDGFYYNRLFADTLDIAVKDETERETFSVIAMDNAGNKSKVLTVKNPYYISPEQKKKEEAERQKQEEAKRLEELKRLEQERKAQETTAATTAPVPVQTSPAPCPAPAPVTTAPVTEAPMPAVTPPSVQAKPKPQQTAAPVQEKPAETEAVPPSVTPTDGGGTVIENSVKGNGEREFFTFEAEDGSTFYLVVDKEKSSGNVYLLVQASKKELTALARDGGEADGPDMAVAPPKETALAVSVTEPPAATQAVTSLTEVSPVAVDSGAEADTPGQDEKKSGSGGVWVILLLAVAGIGGAGYYLKVYKPSQELVQAEDMEDEMEMEDNHAEDEEWMEAEEDGGETED